jgi:hypothetical protein
MKLSSPFSAALPLILAACAAPSKQASPADPASKAESSGASAPGAASPEDRADSAAPGGSPAATGGAPEGKSTDKPAARATSPTNDTGPTGDSATPPASSRLEDYKGVKNTSGGGSYSVAVRSAAGLIPDDVGKAVNGVATKTDACYAKVIKKKPAAGSSSTYEITVDAKGKGAIKLVSDTLKDGDWTKCVEAALKEVSWPKPTEKTGKTTVEFTVGG